jgi:hypothetical protein
VFLRVILRWQAGRPRHLSAQRLVENAGQAPGFTWNIRTGGSPARCCGCHVDPPAEWPFGIWGGNINLLQRSDVNPMPPSAVTAELAVPACPACLAGGS